MWIYLGIGIFFICIGLAVHVFKWYFLISGYNTMSKEKKANVDTKGLGRLIGIYSYINGGVFILAGVVYSLGMKSAIIPAIIFSSIMTVIFLIKAQKYDGNIYDEEGKLKKGAKKKLAIPVVISVISLIFVAIIMFFSSQSTKVTFLDEGLEIHGMYGDVYQWESIDEVKLLDELPTILLRTNGSAVGANLKGHFKTEEYGKVKLFVNKDKPPFIYLLIDDKMTIFNMKEAAETKETFEEILRNIE